MTTRKTTCIMTGCDNPISPRAHSDVCTTCQSGLYYWRHKRPAQVLERRRKLTIFQARISTIIKEK